MGLTNFEGFEGYSSYKDISRLLNMPSGNLFPGTSNLPISVASSTLLYGQNVNNKNNLPNLKFLKVDTASSNLYATINTNPANNATYNLNKYFTPLANIPFKKNIEHGIIGFSIFPALPSGGTYGALGNELEFAPIALLTDSGYFPGLILSINSSGQVILSHYNSSTLFKTNRIDMYDTLAKYGITLFNLRTTPPDYNANFFDQNGNPKNLTSSITPTTPINLSPDSLYASFFNGFDYPANYNDLIAPILAITPNTNNRLYFNYWNYIEIEFDLRNNREEFKIRINRNETSRKIDGSFGPFMSGLPLVSGVSQSGTISNPATVSGTGNSFTILQDGMIDFSGNIGAFNRRYGYINDILYSVDPPFYTNTRGGGNYSDGENDITYLRLKLPVRKGTIIRGHTDGSNNYSVTASVTNYQPRSRTLSNIAFGQMKFYPSTHPHSQIYSTLIDDIYIIDCEDGLSPSGFLGPIACRKTNFNTTIANTAGSGTLAQASETFAGATSLLDSIIFDRLEQSGVFRNTSFSSSESGIKEEVIAIQNTIYGFSINANDYVEYSVLQQGSGLPLRSGVLGTNRVDGGLLFSPIYTTLPNGVALSGLASDSGIQELQYLFIAKSNEEE
jgi:hypothetical protein